MDDGSRKVVSLQRIDLVENPDGGDLFTGPVPVVCGQHFSPLEEIRLEVCCTDARGRRWRSRNDYLVDGSGGFDTSTTPAVGEGYYGVSVEGPWTSMKCHDEGRYDFAWHGLQALTYELTCYRGEEVLWNRRVVRELGKHRAAKILQPHAAVLYFDDEILSEESEIATALSAYGIRVWDGTLRPQVGDAHHLWPAFSSVALPRFIIGSGRASARALEAAIRLENLSGVILFSGGGLRFDPVLGIERDAAGHLFTRDLDYCRLDHSSLRVEAEVPFATRKIYAQAVIDRLNRDRGRIEVEKIACPIYAFSGLDDQVWPSSAFLELIVQRRKRFGCAEPTWHRTFEGVGHDLGPSLGFPTLPTTERSVQHPETGFRLQLGGKPSRQARARRECWDQMLAILNGNPPFSDS